MKRAFKQYPVVFFILSLLAALVHTGCSQTVYVRQNGQTYHDYEAIKHERIEKKESRPKTKKHKKFKKYKKKRRN